MKQEIKLRNPISINGKKVDKLTYDENEITAALFAEADTRRRVAANSKNVAIVPAAEFDFSLHSYLGFAAVVAVNPDIDFSDMERVTGADLVAFMGIGRNFILGVDKSAPDNSEKQSETTV